MTEETKTGTTNSSTETTDAKDVKNLEIKQDIPPEFESNLDLVKDTAERTSRVDEFGFTNKYGNVTLKRDGQINISAGIDSQFKASVNGTIESISLNNFVKTNTYKIDADDIIINNHKFNNKIIDLADYKNVLNSETAIEKTKVIGGLTMLGTVLTKTWDKYLKRYVLVRRVVNIPVFSPSMGATDVHPGLQLTPSTERIKDMQAGLKNSGLDMESYLKAVQEEKQKNAAKTETKKEEAKTTDASKVTEKTMQEVLTHQKG